MNKIVICHLREKHITHFKHQMSFLISSFRHVLYVVCFLLSNYPKESIQQSNVLSWNNFKILAFCKVKLKLFTKWKEVQFGSSLNFRIQKTWNLVPKELQELTMCLFAYLTSTLFFNKLNTATNFELNEGSILMSQCIMFARQNT